MKKKGLGYKQKADRVSFQSRVFKLELDATLALLEGLGTPRALTVYLLLKNGEWQQYLSLGINPEHYTEPNSFMDDYQATEILKKNPRLPTSIDKRQVAIDKFYDAEVECAKANRRIQDFREDPLSVGADVMNTVLRAQDIIQQILGPFPNRAALSRILENMRYGPGATTSTQGIVTQGLKFSKPSLDCTPGLVDFRDLLVSPLWNQLVAPALNPVLGSRLTTVPKNAKTDRCICIEPDLNIYLQLGIGAEIRSRLKRFGLDLNTQEVNQSMAARAWTDGLSTIDLSSASDTLCEEAVHLLLPPAWVDLLKIPRCAFTSHDGKWLRLEKWSSMGNGYTFELESLLFYAVALASTEIARWSDVVTFGDDIILPNESVSLLTRTLNFLGFSVNRDKSFGNGLFHESCGTDWFMGVNVRPFFFRSASDDFPTICYLYANNVRRWANRRHGGWSCDSRCLPCWIRCYRAARVQDQHRIPEGYGDGGFIVDFDDARPPRRAPFKRGWGGYWYTFRRIPSMKRSISQEGCYLSFLSGKITDFERGNESLRGRSRKPRTSIGHSHEWPNLGPWL